MPKLRFGRRRCAPSSYTSHPVNGNGVGRTVLIDGRRAQAPARTGVGQYTLSILRNWPEEFLHEVLGARSAADASPLGTIDTYGPTGLTWHAWAALRVLTQGHLYFSPESLLVPILVGKRAALTIHDLSPLTMPTVHTKRNVVVHNLLLKLALKRVRAIIVPSGAVSDEVASILPSATPRVVVIHEGPRDIAIEERVPLGNDAAADSLGNYVLYVGTIEPRKNVLTLVDAFCDSAPADWRLVIAGKIGWLSPVDAARFKRSCDGSRVTYLGYVDDAALSGLYSAAGIFCYPSEVEGFGLPLIEAMQRGVPVIHSDAGALQEVAGSAGLSVRRSHLADDLRDAIGRLCRDPAARQTIGQAGLLRAAEFSWPRAAFETARVVSGLGDS